MSQEEHPYADITDLRGALRSSEEDVLQAAYEAVYDAGTRPSEVLASDPPEDLLIQAGVIPPSGETRPPVADRWDEVIALLREIRDNTGGQ